MPVIATEIPGPRSRSLFQELNAIQVRSKSNLIIILEIYMYIYLSLPRSFII